MKIAQFTKSLTVSLRSEAYNQIEAITDERKISKADWVRAAVDAALEIEKQKEDDLNEQ
jgi:hypothetical protein